jgi:hypothetical protein
MSREKDSMNVCLSAIVRERGRGRKGEWERDKNCLNGKACFFAFSLIIEGTTEKVLQFMMPFKSICNRNFGFIGQKMYF